MNNGIITLFVSVGFLFIAFIFYLMRSILADKKTYPETEEFFDIASFVCFIIAGAAGLAWVLVDS